MRGTKRLVQHFPCLSNEGMEDKRTTMDAFGHTTRVVVLLDYMIPFGSIVYPGFGGGPAPAWAKGRRSGRPRLSPFVR